ncbi:MAG: c-type cytochrome [Myxococcota bacterium]
MKRMMWSVVALVAVSACGPATREEKVAALTGSASSGAMLYAAQCASCHGADGKGTASGVDLWEPAKNDPATEVIGVIINGKKGTAMASYSGLSDQQLADLYAHLKTFK